MKTKIDLTCPKCEANLTVNADRDFLFCEYCGAKILLSDENTYTIRKVDEAEIIHAQTERLIRLKEIELAEKEAEAINEKNKKQKKFATSLACFGASIMAIGLISYLISKELLFILTASFGFLLLDIAFILVMDTFNHSKK